MDHPSSDIESNIHKKKKPILRNVKIFTKSFSLASDTGGGCIYNIHLVVVVAMAGGGAAIIVGHGQCPDAVVHQVVVGRIDAGKLCVT